MHTFILVSRERHMFCTVWERIHTCGTQHTEWASFKRGGGVMSRVCQAKVILATSSRPGFLYGLREILRRVHISDLSFYLYTHLTELLRTILRWHRFQHPYFVSESNDLKSEDSATVHNFKPLFRRLAKLSLTTHEMHHYWFLLKAKPAQFSQTLLLYTLYLHLATTRVNGTAMSEKPY